MPLTRRSFLGMSLGMAATFSAAQRGRAQGPVKALIALDWYPNANHAGLYLGSVHAFPEKFDATGLIRIRLTRTGAFTGRIS